ncbi:MAG TPA: (d)CMP kinase [Candidatus Ozemobacteraceae bacterium]|nr:(d)CMP kinase [Candidatus Ozemobacteraceae bacterium]
MSDRKSDARAASVIAIDGPAGAGKSTVAKRVAEKLGWSYLDTGAMYRAITFKALSNKIDFADQQRLYTCARSSSIRFVERKGSALPAVFLDNHDVTEAIRDPEVSRNVSHVAKDAKVRECMTKMQREIGSRGHWVVDGRDIGTVVFPEAATKIFLTASIRERARRRLEELQAKGFAGSLESLMEEIAKRDEIDSNREVAPLKQADGAVLVDTTDLTIEQVVDRIISIATVKDAHIQTEERMSDKNSTATSKQEAPMDDSNMTMEELEREMSGEFKTIRNGAIVTGTIIEITPTGVYVDLGYKSDGVISSEEFEGSTKDLKVGEKIRVYVKRVDDGNGQLTLSHRRAREADAWEDIQTAFNNKTPIEGVLKERIKGGYNVDIGGVRAFLPQSQLSHGKNTKEFMGKSFPMTVTEFDRRRKNVVVSERAVVESSRNKRREELFSKYQVGDMIKGTVSRIVEYGAFIDLGDGVEGLIHRNDLSWSVITDPKEVVQVGEEIEAKILKIDNEKGKIGLGLKQKKDDPWATVDQRYEPGRRYQGKVKNLMDFGAFVELEEGVEGLVHISDLSWARNVRHPSDIVKSGDSIQVVVKEIDKTKKRISLSYKDTQSHPWDGIESRFKIGDTVPGKVNNLTDFGAFVEIADGIEGLLHISDMDWVKKINHPKEVLEKGQEIQVKILNIDVKNRRLSLGLKQTMTDPWDALDNTYNVGDVVTGVVKNLVTYGAFVQLENGLEGLLHISEFSWLNDVKDPSQVLKVGDQVTVSVYEVDKSKQKIGLSLRRLSDDPWKGIEKRFPTNSIQSGIVKTLDNNGVEIELCDGVTGFIHVSQIAQNRVQHPSEAVKEGDKVTFKVLEIDRKNRRLKCSIKEAVLDSDQRELRKFQAQSSEGFSDTIGDLLRDKLASLKEQLKD